MSDNVEVVDGVTFANGIAVEQVTEGQEPVGDHADEVSAAKEAVRKALGLDKKDSDDSSEEPASDKSDGKKTPDRGEDGKFKPKEPKETKPEDNQTEDADKATKEPDEDAKQLKRALSERKEAAKLKAQASAELEKARAEARQVYQHFQREREELNREKARIELLKKDPLKAIRENGWDPEEFILDIANDGTPEGQAKRQARELQQHLRELQEWKRAQEESVEAQRREYAEQQKVEARAAVERDFLRTAGEKLPDGSHRNHHIVSMYKEDPAALIVQADIVANRYRQATGKEATYAEIVEYLEERASKWYKELSAPKAGSQVSAPPAQGSSGKKSLGQAGSTERRSLGTVQDLDGEERLEAAKEAVRSALRSGGHR